MSVRIQEVWKSKIFKCGQGGTLLILDSAEVQPHSVPRNPSVWKFRFPQLHLFFLIQLVSRAISRWLTSMAEPKMNVYLMRMACNSTNGLAERWPPQ